MPDEKPVIHTLTLCNLGWNVGDQLIMTSVAENGDTRELRVDVTDENIHLMPPLCADASKRNFSRIRRF